MLIIVSGLQGTGKTTVAKKITKEIKGVLLRTDVIRRDLFEVPEYIKKIYPKDQMQKVYDEMFSQARILLKKNRNVVLDATFLKKENREKAKKISKGHNFEIIEIVCPEKIVEMRMKKRFKGESKAKFEHYLKYKNIFEPIKEKHIIINTSKNIDSQLKKIK